MTNKSSYTKNCFRFFPGPASVFLLLLSLVIWGCFPSNRGLPPGDPDNGGLSLPDSFEAVVVIDSIPGKARHLAVKDNGDLYVKLRFSGDEGGVVGLRDKDGDGKADLMERFGKYTHEGKWSLQTGVRIYNGYLYFSSELEVFRIKLDDDLVPGEELELIVKDDHAHGKHEHIAKPFTFDDQGHIYVPFGAPSNACQEPKRTPGAPGLDPCPQLEDHAGIWRFDANKLNQTQDDGYKYATGIRSIVAIDWNHADNSLYVVIHGRDDLLRLFPNVYTPWQSALLPSEEFVKVTDGANFGWPYCYYDQIQERKVLCPEYGGDGVLVGRCEDMDNPIIGFPGHWAPNDLLFYTGKQFPDRYKNGAFIAFHGSTNRAPFPQSGYFIGFVPFANGQPSGEWEVFADGFAGVDPIVSVNDALFRPMGIAMGPDGSLYLGDTEKGKIWRVMYKGKKENFRDTQLAMMEQHKLLSHIRTPNEIEDNLQKEALTGGEELYYIYCGICHQQDGEGASGRFPSLVGTDWVLGDEERLISVVLKGLEGSIEVNGEVFDGVMPQHSYLKNEEVAQILTYIRGNWGNDGSGVAADEVGRVRRKLK